MSKDDEYGTCFECKRDLDKNNYNKYGNKNFCNSCLREIILGF